MLAHRHHHAYPCSRSHLTPRGDGRTCFTVTTRFTMSTEQRTESRRQTPRSVAPILRHNSRVPMPEDAPGTFCPLFSVLCHPSLVGLGRFERPTSRLSGVRSDQLSYRPRIREQRTEIRWQTRPSGAPRANSRACLLSVHCSLSSDLEGMRGRRPGSPALQKTSTEPRRQTWSAVCALSSAFCP